MNWGNRGAPEEPAEAPKGKSALPPQCPRCELTKSQFTRTIQNYQKAYRKKVEGLKTELRTIRATNVKLTKQVKRLKSFRRLHVPSILLGAALLELGGRLYRFIKAKQPAKAEPTAAQDGDEPSA